MPPSPLPAPLRSPALLSALAVMLAACFAAITWQVLRHDVTAEPQFFLDQDDQARDLGGLLAVDPAVAGWVIDHRTGALTAAAHTVSALGATLSMTVLGTLACAVLLRAGDRSRAALVAVTGLGAAVIVFAGKRLIGRERPPAADRLAYEPSLSYPSGHSLGSCVVVAVCAAVFLPLLHRRTTRIAGAALAVAFVLSVGWSRVYLGVHWPTDVVGAWCAGAAWMALCLAVFHLRRPGPDESPTTADAAGG
ncbi:phosphatase PAP2 family protein [Nocardia farcinica]|uniref:phosphatase PAP2 family protein n=1 Tax=Nocardia farcinica TaxID=37329 RepID=UPI0024547DC8|nr:phosphatase PAP2 family protein [Nocardia farcinica]